MILGIFLRDFKGHKLLCCIFLAGHFQFSNFSQGPLASLNFLNFFAQWRLLNIYVKMYFLCEMLLLSCNPKSTSIHSLPKVADWLKKTFFEWLVSPSLVLVRFSIYYQTGCWFRFYYALVLLSALLFYPPPPLSTTAFGGLIACRSRTMFDLSFWQCCCSRAFEHSYWSLVLMSVPVLQSIDSQKSLKVSVWMWP